VQEFDWSLTELPSKPVLQWGAFYSDCMHEVHKVTSGARSTVTYNLTAVKAGTPLLRVSPQKPLCHPDHIDREIVFPV
jgi:hypothetical protein